LRRNSACLGRRSIAGRAALLAAIPGKLVARCPGYPNVHGRAATGPSRHRVQDGLPCIPPGCVGLAGSCSGGAARQRLPRSTPRLISCHPSGMAFGRRASRRDAGILAGGRGRVFCGRHPRKPSPRKFTRTPAGARGKPRGIERAATGGQPPTAGPVRCRTWRVMIRTQSWTWNGGSVRPQRRIQRRRGEAREAGERALK
jgi:hypothetical protein